MKASQLPLLIFAIGFLLLPHSARSQAPPEPAKPQANPGPRKMILPADTTIPLVLKNTLSSKTAFAGMGVYCETIYPITLGNRIVIPVGSYVKGAITQVVRPGRVKGKAQLGLRFDSLTLPNGTTRPLRATLSSFAGNSDEAFKREESKIEGSGSKSSDAERIATTATQGTIIGGISSRSPKGAGIGALSGGLTGLIWVLATRGKEIVLPPGTNLELQLSSPISFEPDEVEPSSRYDEGPALPRRE